jgi:tRNA1Val (adenine37-N6)-methyltransferase
MPAVSSTGDADQLGADVTADVTIDRLLGGTVLICQPDRGYRVAIDPVLLAAAVSAAPGDRILDVGAGTGAVSLCLAKRVTGLSIVAVERDAVAVGLARRSVTLNGLEAVVEIVEADLTQLPTELRRQTFDHVVTNPPFLEPARAGANPGSKSSAHIESVGLGEWVQSCLRRLRPEGRLTLIQRADRLDLILAALSGAAGDVRILPLWPKADAARATRVLVSARKGSRGPLRLLRGLDLHQADGRYTSTIDSVLRRGDALDL